MGGARGVARGRTAVPLGSSVPGSPAAGDLKASAARAVPQAAVRRATAQGRMTAQERAAVRRRAAVTVGYGAGGVQQMDVIPGAATSRPGVFVVHGGWWSAGDKKTFAPVAQHFARQGYAVFNLNYRLTGAATWPAQRDDVVAAIAYARRNAARYRFDRDRYVIVGFSAGGHLAASVGVMGGRPYGLRGVVGFSPVVSPKLAHAHGRDGVQEQRLSRSAVALAGCGPARCPAVWSSMEVAEHAGPGDAPALLFHSVGDFVPPGHSFRLAGRLRGLDVRVVPGTGHSTELYAQAALARTADHWIAAALA
ncbi:alpha/beta hydrolase [Nonomuraea longicatena]